MTVFTEAKVTQSPLCSPSRAKLRMLEQMAEALDDEAAVLYRRTAAFEEEEFLLNREIEERQTEINRMLLKLDAMRAERDRVVGRIESISQEASAIREEVFDREEDIAIASMGAMAAEVPTEPECSDCGPIFTGGDPSRSAMFFRRMTLADEIRQA